MENLTLMGVLEAITGKDSEHMTTDDLLRQSIKVGQELDVNVKANLIHFVLQQLDNGSYYVTGLAIKCLARLVKMVSEHQVLEMTNKLCDKLLNWEEKICDIANIALKTIFAEMPTSSVSVALPSLLKLKQGLILQEKSSEVKYDCLDVLCDVLHKYGNLMGSNHHEELFGAVLPQLDSNDASVRSKAVSCIALLASTISDDLLAKATAEAVQILQDQATKSEITRTTIHMIERLRVLSRAVGYRFGRHLGNVVPVLIECCINASKNGEELLEYALQALENFLLRCPGDISSYCEQILHLSLQFLCHNPNFTGNMEEDKDDESYIDEEDDESASEYPDDEDDEDESWKVRRAAAKCLAALIVSRPEVLPLPILYEEACPILISRFKEREKIVKMDIFRTFVELLRQIVNVTGGQRDFNESRCLLKKDVPEIVRAVNLLLHKKSIKTKVGAFSVLKELVDVLPGCLADHIESLMPGIEKALCDNSATKGLKIEALVFMRLALASHAAPVFHPHVKAISVAVTAAVGERFYEVRVEALRVCGELVRVLRPDIEDFYFDFKPYVNRIYGAIMLCLTNQDQDQEVKECAISCMGLVVSTFGDHLKGELPSCLFALVDRMQNEITRLTAVKAFAVIAASPFRLDLSCVLEHVCLELTAFLRKANPALRQATLKTLNILIAGYGDEIGSDAYEGIIVELPTLISDSDMCLTAKALELCCTLMADVRSCSNATVRIQVLPQALTLIGSSLIDGPALRALQDFFGALVSSASTSFDVLLDALLSTATQAGAVGKCALCSIAQCVADICLAGGDKRCFSAVNMLTGILKDDSSSNLAQRYLSLLCLGEIGRRKDLSSHEHIENIVFESFKSPFEEIAFAACYALGNMAVGNLPKYLPFILDKIDNQQNQYLLLHSLKEVLMRQSVDKSEFDDSSVENITNLLLNHCKSESDAVRDMVAKCLAKIALVAPKKLVPALKKRIINHAALTQATVLTAVKYSIAEQQENLDEILYPEISSFLMCIRDKKQHVRLAAVLALTAAAQNKPKLIKGLLPKLLPFLYKLTLRKKESITRVNPGVFKLIDGELELRRAAFECVDTLLDNCLDNMDATTFIVPYLLSGLDDHHEVKMPCLLIILKLADKCPSAVLAVLDSLVSPLHRTINSKPKFNALKQEVARYEDMIWSALQTVVSLNRISGQNCSQKLKNLMDEIAKSKTLSEKYSSIQNEIVTPRSSVNVDFTYMLF